MKGSVGNSVYFNEFVPASERLTQSINGIYDVNMQAVVRKNQQAHLDSSRFTTSMAIIGSICLVLALSTSGIFPSIFPPPSVILPIG